MAEVCEHGLGHAKRALQLLGRALGIAPGSPRAQAEARGLRRPPPHVEGPARRLRRALHRDERPRRVARPDRAVHQRLDRRRAAHRRRRPRVHVGQEGLLRGPARRHGRRRRARPPRGPGPEPQPVAADARGHRAGARPARVQQVADLRRLRHHRPAPVRRGDRPRAPRSTPPQPRRSCNAPTSLRPEDDELARQIETTAEAHGLWTALIELHESKLARAPPAWPASSPATRSPRSTSASSAPPRRPSPGSAAPGTTCAPRTPRSPRRSWTS
jgi:hypothetical protein